MPQLLTPTQTTDTLLTRFARLTYLGLMPRKHSRYDAKDDRTIKTAGERHAELERAGLIHRVEGKPGRSAFPLGVRRPGAFRRFLEERD